MCGLVGIYSSNMQNRHKDCLASMLYLDTWRGRDSTGVAAIRQNADTSILKSTVPGYEFVEGPRLDSFLRLGDFCWIGHNRHGTIGKNIKSNAHPFQILDEQGSCILVGAHNGTLKNKHALDNHQQFGTDSEALFSHIAVHGLEATMPIIDGAWALTYYDHVAEELRFIRNKERSLFYAWEEDKKTLIWASEQWMIRVAASRCNIKLHEDKVWSFAEDTLYKCPAPDKINDVLEFERQGGLVGKQAQTFFQQGSVTHWKREGNTGNNGGNHSRSQSQTPPQTRKPTPEQSKTPVTDPTGFGVPLTTNGGTQPPKSQSSLPGLPSSGTDNKVVPITDAKMYKAFGGKLIPKAEMLDQLADGCHWCEQEYIDINDKFGWLAPNTPVCQKCIEGEQDEEIHDHLIVTMH